MIPNLFVKPISKNVVRVVLSTGAVIEISDHGDIGAEIHIAETEENLSLAKFKRIRTIPKGSDETGLFRVEMMGMGTMVVGKKLSSEEHGNPEEKIEGKP